MPSWNIHTAHVERLLREEGADALGISDVNAFLVGNFVPDIYVGYMVPNPSHRIDYKMTHIATLQHIPLPDYRAFWEFYVEGWSKPVSDLTLGAWAHLVADHVYNKHTRAFLEQAGLKPGERARIAKQSDFALFGRTLRISMTPEVTDALVKQCADFPQYSIARADVEKTVEVARTTVEQNCTNQLDEEPDYRLLTTAFFEDAFAEAHEKIAAGLKGRKTSC